MKCGQYRFTGQGIGQICWVAIAPAARGRGLGKPMLSAACAALRERGYTQAFVDTNDRSPLVAPDERVAEAIDLVASKRDDNGRWSLETQYPGKMPVETDEGEGRPSRWNTLRALRVLDWYSARD